mgnify:CR=1 FL=1
MKLKRLKLKVSAIKANAGLPQITVTVPTSLSRVGTTANFIQAETTETVTRTKSKVINGVLTALVGTTVTLARGDTYQFIEQLDAPGYATLLMSTDVRTYGAINDVLAEEWGFQEQPSDARTRESFGQVFKTAPSEFLFYAVQGNDATGLADVSAGTPVGLALIALNEGLPGIYNFDTTTKTPLGGVSHARLVEVDTTDGSRRWASAARNFTASNIPVAPSVTFATGTGPGAINVTFSAVVDGRGRSVTVDEFQFDSGAWITLPGPAGTARTVSVTVAGTAAGIPHVRSTNINGTSAVTTGASVTPGTVPAGLVFEYPFSSGGVPAVFIPSESPSLAVTSLLEFTTDNAYPARGTNGNTGALLLTRVGTNAGDTVLNNYRGMVYIDISGDALGTSYTYLMSVFARRGTSTIPNVTVLGRFLTAANATLTTPFTSGLTAVSATAGVDQVILDNTFTFTKTDAAATKLSFQLIASNWTATTIGVSFIRLTSTAVAPPVATSITTPASLSMSGANLVITRAVFAGTPAPTASYTLTRDGIDVLSEVSAGQITGAVAGDYVLTDTGTNGVGADAASTASLTVAAADTVIYSETFSGGSYPTAIGTTGYFFATTSVFPFTPAAGTITLNNALAGAYPGQTTGALVWARGAGADTQKQGLLVPIADPTREHRVQYNFTKDNTSGTVDSASFKIEWYDAAGALLLTRTTTSVGTAADFQIQGDFLAYPPATAAWLAIYCTTIRTSRANLRLHDLTITQLAASYPPVTPTAANITITDPFLFPGNKVNLNYISTINSYSKTLLGLEYRFDYGSGYGLWEEIEGPTLGTYSVDAVYNDSFTMQVRARNELGYSGTYTAPSLTTAYAAPTLANQTVPFGALTLAGAGGAMPLDSNNQEVTITSYDSLVSGSLGAYTPVVSGGALTFTGAAGAPNGAVLRCTVAGFGTRDLTISTEANVYSARNEADMAGILALSDATLASKTIKMRPGRIRWPNAGLDARDYGNGTPLTITSHVAANRTTLWEETNQTWTNPRNINFYRVNIQGLSNPAVASSGASPFIGFSGLIRNLYFTECDLDGGIRESIRLYGPGNGKGWRGIVGGAATEIYGVFEIRDCTIHDSWRGLNIGPTTAGAMRRIIGNTFSYNTTDALLLAGTSDFGTEILWNTFTKPVPRPITPIQVTSVDVAANSMTVTDPTGSLPVGDTTVNMNPNTVTMPGGVNLPGVGGSNDYACTVSVVSGTTKLVVFPVDITSTGSGVWLNQEQGHADFIQFVVGAGVIMRGLKIIGNVLHGQEGEDQDKTWPQNIFLEDIAGPVAHGGTWDLTANTFTISDPGLLVGPSPVKVTIFGTGTLGAGVPGGLVHKAVYSCAYTGTTTKVLQFPVDVTSAGTTYTLSPHHFGYYEDAVVAANYVWGGNAYGLVLSNAVRSLSAANTFVAPLGTVATKLPTDRFSTQFGFNGRDSVMMSGVAYAHTTTYPAGAVLFADNLDVTPAGYATAGVFAGTGGYDPRNVSQFMAAFARTDLNGTIDYTARAYDLKEINTPNAFTVTNATGAALNAVVTHAAIQITSVTKYPSGASAVGVFATVTSAAGALPELRVTSDIGGSTVVTNWTTAPVTVLAGQYLWVRGTASGVAATARIVSLRVGDRVQEWTITTA